MVDSTSLYGWFDSNFPYQEITIQLLRDAMRYHKDCPGFLIDGFPREIQQGMQFEKEVRIFFLTRCFKLFYVDTLTGALTHIGWHIVCLGNLHKDQLGQLVWAQDFKCTHLRCNSCCSHPLLYLFCFVVIVCHKRVHLLVTSWMYFHFRSKVQTQVWMVGLFSTY